MFFKGQSVNVPVGNFESLGILLGLASVPCFFGFWFARQHAPVYPGLTGAATSLASGFLGSLGAHFVYPIPHTMHALLMHTIPVLLFTAIGFFLGRAFLRW